MVEKRTASEYDSKHVFQLDRGKNLHKLIFKYKIIYYLKIHTYAVFVLFFNQEV